MPGIKVDKARRHAAAVPSRRGGTEGLERLARAGWSRYRELGAKFCKWRAVLDIGRVIPSYYCIRANAAALARYAALCQDETLVPIVEPEVLMDGDHDIDRCYEVTEKALNTLFQELYLARVKLEGIVLKPNMVVPGKKRPNQASVAEVAEKTLRVLKECVPAAVPGIAFLSGGQSDLDATARLDAMNRLSGGPWNITFSYSRALQAAPQKAWSGKAENVGAAQAAFAHRAAMNGLASIGRVSADLPRRRSLTPEHHRRWLTVAGDRRQQQRHRCGEIGRGRRHSKRNARRRTRSSSVANLVIRPGGQSLRARRRVLLSAKRLRRLRNNVPEPGESLGRIAAASTRASAWGGSRPGRCQSGKPTTDRCRSCHNEHMDGVAARRSRRTVLNRSTADASRATWSPLGPFAGTPARCPLAPTAEQKPIYGGCRRFPR
jgi:fructose-bisphosphate aldolase class I